MSQPMDRALRARAARVIPGGMYGHQAVGGLPEGYPQFFTRAEGPWLWDTDGNLLLDLMCAYGPQLFGYAHHDIDQAYVQQMSVGDAMTGPSPLIVDLAEAMVAMVGHADWAMFCKNGSDATTMALMVARAHTGRNAIVRAAGAYHGSQPWSNPRPRGIAPTDQAGQHICIYNDVASLEASVKAAGSDLAAIFASPYRHDVFIDQASPSAEYARRARELADETCALLIVDEVRAGFRIARDSSWSLLGVAPDLSCWGKAIANGHPISALMGAEKARGAAEKIYATGSYWFAAAAMAASLATLKLIRESDYLERITTLGESLRRGLDRLAGDHGFTLRQTGPAQMPLILFDNDPDMRLGYSWSASMIKHGVYMHPWHNMFISAAMTDANIDFALEAAEQSFAELADAAPGLGPNTRYPGPRSA